MSGSEVSAGDEEFRCRHCGQTFTAAEKPIHRKNPCAQWLDKKKSKASTDKKEKNGRGKTRAQAPETEDESWFTPLRPEDDILSVPSLKRGHTPTESDEEEPPSKKKEVPPSKKKEVPPSKKKEEPPSKKKEEPPSKKKEEPPSKKKEEPPAKRTEESSDKGPKRRKQPGQSAIRRSKKTYNKRVIGEWVKGNGA